MPGIVITMTVIDYEYMCENGGEWSEIFGQQSDQELADRFRNGTNLGRLPGRH
ncbi:hypothetical protein [Streptomyces sp. bgisy082]|uniref:hypothetical protein n=1 Tax=Streptomyces sp. bgisy082 TaxID=3413776 RepID=UPI003D712A62